VEACQGGGRAESPCRGRRTCRERRAVQTEARGADTGPRRPHRDAQSAPAARRNSSTRVNAPETAADDAAQFLVDVAASLAAVQCCCRATAIDVQ